MKVLVQLHLSSCFLFVCLMYFVVGKIAERNVGALVDLARQACCELGHEARLRF